MRLLPVAEYFGFAALHEGVASFVSQSLEVTLANVGAVYVMAERAQFEGLQERCAELVHESFPQLPNHGFNSLPRGLLCRMVTEGIDAEHDAILARLVRWGYHALGRPPPRDVSRIRIADDSDLQRVLAGLLPPTVVMSRRNKLALLGRTPLQLPGLV